MDEKAAIVLQSYDFCAENLRCRKTQETGGMGYVPYFRGKKLADKIYLMVVKAPRISANCKPGEFVIVKMDEKGERIPLTICDYDREKETITIVFQTVGASTERMSALQAGDSFRDVVGPLGNPSDFVKEDIEELKKKNICSLRAVSEPLRYTRR